MHRSNSRPSSGHSDSERPSGKGKRLLLESGPEEPQGPCEIEAVTCRILYRNVLIQAVHDLGFGGLKERDEVRQFLDSPRFLTLCEYANWNDDWARRVFRSIDLLRDSIRRDITSQVTHMLKAVAQVGLD